MTGIIAVKIRSITVEDVAAIAAIHAAGWRHAYRGIVRDGYLDGDLEGDRRRAWTTLLASPSFGPGWIAHEDGAPVGFIDLTPRADPRWGTQVEHLHVLPSSHGRGVGRALMRTAGAWCQEHAPEVGLFLWVLTGNRGGRQFYARMGGEEVESGLRLSGEGEQVPAFRVVWPAPLQIP